MKKMSFGKVDVTNCWKYLNFINSENASVMVVAMRRLYASRLTKCLVIEAYVSGILFRAWQWEVRPWPMPESTMWKSLLKFEHFQLLITSILPKLIYFMHSLSYFKFKVQSPHLCNLNEIFIYLLLHKHIICTTLSFHRAFSVANWSWLPSSCTYYPAFTSALEMVPELSSIHHFNH